MVWWCDRRDMTFRYRDGGDFVFMDGDTYDQIPEDTRDPGLLKAKKALKKKKPTRSETRQYWGEAQFKQLQAAPPGKLYSKGPLPWRLLAYLLGFSAEVSRRGCSSLLIFSGSESFFFAGRVTAWISSL